MPDYQKLLFKNLPDETTPVSAENLNHMDGGIANNDTRLTDIEEGISTGVIVSSLVKSVNDVPVYQGAGVWGTMQVSAIANDGGYSKSNHTQVAGALGSTVDLEILPNVILVVERSGIYEGKILIKSATDDPNPFFANYTSISSFEDVLKGVTKAFNGMSLSTGSIVIQVGYNFNAEEDTRLTIFDINTSKTYRVDIFIGNAGGFISTFTKELV